MQFKQKKSYNKNVNIYSIQFCQLFDFRKSNIRHQRLNKGEQIAAPVMVCTSYLKVKNDKLIDWKICKLTILFLLLSQHKMKIEMMTVTYGPESINRT